MRLVTDGCPDRINQQRSRRQRHGAAAKRILKGGLVVHLEHVTTRYVAALFEAIAATLVQTSMKAMDHVDIGAANGIEWPRLVLAILKSRSSWALRGRASS